MNRSAKTLLYSLVPLAIAAGGFLLWQGGAAHRRWEQLRPATPAAVGDSAPGLDARLATSAEKFARWPVDRAALAEYALLCHANGLLPEAIPGYEALIALDPAEARWPHLLAGILSGFGRMDEALPLLSKTTELAPEQSIGWLRLGEARLKNNQTTEAAAAFAQVLRRKSAETYALFGLARCDLQAGRLTAARSRLQEAVAADPDFPGAQSLLATVFEQLGNPAAAEAARLRVRGDGHYTEAPDPWAVDLTAYCHNPYTLLVAASALSSDGKHREALPLLERAITLAPRDARLHRQQGNALVRLGDLPAARPKLERALTLDPANEKIRTDLINVLKGLKDIPAVDQVVREGLVASPQSMAFRFEAGLSAARNGHTDEAIGYFEEVWQRQPDQTAAPCELATVYFASGRAEDGQTVLEKIIAQHPDDPATLTMLVRRGIEVRDPRTGDWMRRAQATGKALPALAELRQAYFARFGTMP
jgi:tetratricopeptide (TPR) repeat protein